jgi:AcrR family transcriptional regulator
MEGTLMPGKKEFNKELKRLTILNAAKKLFIEKKYNTITVDEIAKIAGITKRTLYLYYPSKLALFIHVFDKHLQDLHQQLAKGTKQDLPIKELIISLIQILHRFTKKNEKFMRLFWTLDSDEFNGNIPEELLRRITVWTRAMFEDLIKIVELGQREGVIVDYNPELLIHLLSALNKGIFIHTNKESRFSIADIDPDSLYEIAVNLLSAGLFKQLPQGK